MPRVPFIDSFRIRESDLKIVGADGSPVGMRFNFYYESKAIPVEVSRNPFPGELCLQSGQQPTSMKSQQEILQRLKNHIAAVLKMPQTKRVGSSKWWHQEVSVD